MNAMDREVAAAGGRVVTLVKRRRSGQYFARVKFPGNVVIQRTGSSRSGALRRCIDGYRAMLALARDGKSARALG